MNRPPLTCEEWANAAARYHSLACELIHQVDSGRLVEAPGSSFRDRQNVRAYLSAVRSILADGPFDSEPDDFDSVDGDDSGGGT